MTDEARLIRDPAAGDRDAFERLVRSRQARVFWTAFQVVGNEEDARDVAQEVFIRLWRSLPRYRPEQRFDTWLYRITVNLAIDACRRRRARPELVAAETGEIAAPHGAGGPADALRSDEVQRIFLRLARRLSAQQRAVFVLKEMNGLDNSEICSLLDISRANLWTLLHRARVRLRRDLDERWSAGDRAGTRNAP